MVGTFLVIKKTLKNKDGFAPLGPLLLPWKMHIKKGHQQRTDSATTRPNRASGIFSHVSLFRCHMSHIMCHVSPVMCHLSHVSHKPSPFYLNCYVQQAGLQGLNNQKLFQTQKIIEITKTQKCVEVCQCQQQALSPEVSSPLRSRISRLGQVTDRDLHFETESVQWADSVKKC